MCYVKFNNPLERFRYCWNFVRPALQSGYPSKRELLLVKCMEFKGKPLWMSRWQSYQKYCSLWDFRCCLCIYNVTEVYSHENILQRLKNRNLMTQFLPVSIAHFCAEMVKMVDCSNKWCHFCNAHIMWPCFHCFLY